MFNLFLRHDAFSFALSSELFSFVLFRARKYLFMASAVRPPVEAVPTANSAAVAMQNGHMRASFCYCLDCLLSCSSSGALGFGVLADELKYVCPAQGHPGFVFVGNKSQRGVTECDQGSVFLLTQAILHIVYDWSRHEEWASEFEQRGALDGLHGGPEMAVVAAEVAIPASAGPRLDLHGQRFAVVCFIMRTDLLEQRGKGYI